MKAGVQLGFFMLAFWAGWLAKGYFQEGAIESSVLPEGWDIGVHLNTRSTEQPVADTPVLSEHTAEVAVIENKAPSLSDNLITSFEELLFQHRIQAFSQYLRENLTLFSAADIHALGAIFVSYALSIGLDQYQSSFELMNIEARIASLDTYAPSTQFFDVIEQANVAPLTALKLFDELASYYQEQVTDVQLQRLEHWLAQYVEAALIGRQDWLSLEAWYRALIDRSTDPEGLYRQLASLHYQLGRNIESLEMLDKIAAVSEWNAKDEALYEANSLAVANESVEAVPLEKVGEHYMVTVRLNSRVNAAMLLDTGASISGLDQQFIQANGFEINGRKIRLATAGGAVESDLVRLHKVEFGQNQINNLDVASLGLGAGTSASKYQGLLGMDVLGRFEFYLDQRKAMLYLRPLDSGSELPPEF